MSDTTYQAAHHIRRPILLEQIRRRRLMRQLNEEATSLKTRFNGLVMDIVDREVEYAKILDIRKTYYQRISAANRKKYEDPIAKLELYKRLTKRYHNDYVAARFTFVAHEDIEPLREADNAIASITYRLIDLSNADKNKFVSTMKRLRDIERQLALPS